ncbi:SDR family oxidoreductase [Kineosporia mesophila]|uniref:SDR family oxidoreductase n=1 Tax=Kineosporia mesophila TaxID=566012 RepID=A0ABP7ALY7_9ACTN|nr:SDR family oxidoreductase [Kineosporia mesophila]
MSGKSAVVTGAASGIGSAVSVALLDAGYRVLGIDRSDPGAAGGHLRYQHVKLDVTDSGQLADVIGEQFVPGEESSVLVTSAGQREICHTRELEPGQFRQILEVNTTAVFVAGQAFCERLISASVLGSIVNIASVAGFLGEPRRTAYVTSKHATIGLTKQFAVDYAEFGIRANAVAPGVIRTPLTESYFGDEEQVDRILQGQLLKRVGAVGDVERAVLFLADPAGSFITGSTVFVDGGWSAAKVL